MSDEKGLTTTLLFSFLAAVLIFLAVSFQAVRYTTTNDFCTSCHSMSFAFEEYKKSRHYKSRSGVMVGCSDCHVGKGFRKVFVFNQLIPDLWAEVKNSIKDKADWDKRRGSLAKKVRKTLECRGFLCQGCHDPVLMKPVNERNRIAHTRIKIEGMTCIECHKNLVHAEVD